MDLEFMKFSNNQFETLKTNTDKALVFGKLKALENLALYIDSMRESLTRLLVVNGIEDEEDYEEQINPTKKEDKKEDPFKKENYNNNKARSLSPSPRHASP
tara:strand:- start:713 stop:1015 length:303 start_codon:yes stop_codon:yes gene_type:complete